MSHQPVVQTPDPNPPEKTGKRQRQGGSIGKGCGLFVLGFVLAVILIAATIFFLYFYNNRPPSNLVRPPVQTSVPDITATFSQTYLNREITRQLGITKYKAGPVELVDLVVRIKEGAQVELDIKAITGPFHVDLSVTELIIIQDGLVKLDLVGSPRLMGGFLPPGINGLLDIINTQFIEPQLNQQLTKIIVNQRPIRITGATSTEGLLTVRANVE